MDSNQQLKTDFIDEEIFLLSHCVNPQEINPSTIGTQHSLPLLLEDYQILKEDNFKPEMEEFRDLRTYLPESQFTNELNTPQLFEENKFDFDIQKPTEKPFKLDYNLTETDSVTIGKLNKDLSIQQHQNDSEFIINYIQQQQKDFSSPETPLIVNDDQISCASYIEDNSVLCDKYSNASSPTGDGSNILPPRTIETPPSLMNMENFYTIKDEYSNSTMSSEVSVKKERPKLHLDLGYSPVDSSINTPEVINSVISLDDSFNIFEYINDKEATTVKLEDLLPTTSTSSTTSTTTKTNDERKRSRRSLNEDEEYYDYQKEQTSDSDEDYVPRKKKRGRPPKRRISVDSSVSSDASKYRELRNKNNEASRKSRLKRKIKEKRLEEEAEILNQRNIKLKAQVSELERMVNSFRENVLKIIVKKK